MSRTVAQVVFTQHAAGVERHVTDLSAALVGRGWRSIVMTGADAAPAALARYRQAGIEVVVVEDGSVAGRAKAVIDASRRLRFDLLHAHLGNAMVACALAEAGGGPPAVATAHFIRPRHQTRRGAVIRGLAYRRVLRRMKAIIAISGVVADALRPQLGRRRDKLVIVPHGIPDLSEPPAPAPERDPPVLLLAGRLEREKRPEFVVRAAMLATGGFELWVAGDGALAPDLGWLADTQARGRVRMLGFVSDLEPLYRRSAAVVMACSEEAFGLVAVEAMRAARPVIAADAGALPELLGGVGGVAFPSGDARALARAMDELANSHQLATRLGQAARRRYEGEYRAERMAMRTAAVYEGAVAG